MSDQKKKPEPEKKQPAHPCPLCKSGGREYSRRSTTLYLRCTSCGHTWTETPRANGVEVAYRTVEIQSR